MSDLYYSSRRKIKRMPKVLVLLIVIVVIAAIGFAGKLAYDNWGSITSLFEQEQQEEVVVEPTKTMLFDVCIDSMDVRTFEVERNSTLSDILEPYGVSPQQVHKLATLDTKIFNPRGIKSGNKYITITTKDSIPVLKHFIYSESMVDFVVCSLGDSIEVHKYSKEVTTRQRTLSGTINSSLYMSIVDGGGRDDLAYYIADVYQWTIDFYGIQKGDSFTVIYDEKLVDSTVIGIDKIVASRFEHIGKDYFAFGFVDGDTPGFWDENGESLKKTFLKAPLQFSRISSNFSYARRHPITKKVQAHLGVDYAAPSGTPVWAVADGVVVRRSYDGLNGNFIKIKHSVRGGRYQTGYIHLKSFAKGISVGSRVVQGQVIGYVGSTGRSTGPHLDFRIWDKGRAINPLKMTQEKGQPISDTTLNSYTLYKDSMINVLNTIPRN